MNKNSKFFTPPPKPTFKQRFKALDPDASIIWGSIERFEKQLEELENKQDENI